MGPSVRTLPVRSPGKKSGEKDTEQINDDEEEDTEDGKINDDGEGRQKDQLNLDFVIIIVVSHS